jgi:subtilisin family serine protease
MLAAAIDRLIARKVDFPLAVPAPPNLVAEVFEMNPRPAATSIPRTNPRDPGPSADPAPTGYTQTPSRPSAEIERTIVPGEIVVGIYDRVGEVTAAVDSLMVALQQSYDRLAAWSSDLILSLDQTGDRSIDVVQVQFDEKIDVEEVVKQVAGLTNVAWASPNFQYSGDIKDYIPNDPNFEDQYHHVLMGNTLAWDTTLGSSDVVIAVTDDGVQLDHPDLAANIWTNPGEIPGNFFDDDGNGYDDDDRGWDFVADDNNPSPEVAGDTHGTHVSGIVAGVTDNSTLIAGTSGGSRIMPLRIAGNDGGFTSTIMAEAFAYAIDNGARIANTSYNIDGFVGDPIYTAGLQYYYDGGGLHFNSAGNSGALNPPRGVFDQTLLVVSTTSSDTISGFSNYGETVDVSAPGSNILSTVTGGGTDIFSGTSMAAPNAAGVAALVWSAFPSYTRDQVAALLMGTSDNIDGVNPGFEGWLGTGRVNSGRALNETLAAPTVASLVGLPDDGTAVDIGTPVDTFRLRFDQLMDPASVQTLSNFEFRGSGSNGIFGDGDDDLYVLDYNTYQIGTNFLEFTVIDFPGEIGEYRFTATSGGLQNPFGVALDGNDDGTAGDDYQHTFRIKQPSFEPLDPRGSLVYDLSVPGSIPAAGSLDAYTFDLDAGQTLSLLLSGSDGLQGTVELRDPSNSVIASGSASAVDGLALVQTVPLLVSGAYTVSVGGVGSNVGQYDLRAVLNAAIEDEAATGIDNGSAANAQDLSSSLVTVAGGLGRRLALVSGEPGPSVPVPLNETEPNDDGTAGGSIGDLAFAEDWTQSFAPIGGGQQRAIGIGEISVGDDGDWDFFRFTATPGDTLVLTLQGSPSGLGTLSDPLVRLYDDSGTQIASNDDFGSLESQLTYSSFAYAGDFYAVADSFGANVGTYTMTATIDQATTNDEDWYEFTLADGETATITVVDTEGDPVVELYDAAEALITSSIGRAGNRQVIDRFTDLTSDTADDTYYVRVTGGGAYSLLVTVDADFDTEVNSAFGLAQEDSGSAFGFVDTAAFATASLLQDFPGISESDSFCGCEPPDTHAAAGPNHIVEVVNTAIAMYDKSGGIARASEALTSFFDAAIVAGETFDFDPVVAYMEDVQRWAVGVLIAASAATDESDFLVAISDTSDPTGSWSEQHRFDFGGVSPGLFADYPKVGWNADSLVYTFNMFDTSFVDVNILSIDKATLLDTNPATVASFINERPSSSFTMAPATMHGSVAGDPMWLVEESGFGGSRTDIRVVKMEDALTSSAVFTDYSVPVSVYGSGGLPAAPQPGGSRTTNDARILNSEWRDDRLVAAHTANIGGESKVRWYEFDTNGSSPTLQQEGLIDPGPGVATYFPSVAINAAGDIGLTFMQSSSSEFTSMYVAGQAQGVTGGGISVPVLAKAGNQTYPGSRSGDYSGITVDPVTDSFWAANEVSLSGTPDPLWSTHIAEFSVLAGEDADYYQFAVSAGDALILETYTPFDGPLEIDNTIDLQIELYAPDGSLVAADDNSAADGRNALINHSASETGTYTVRVGGAAGAAAGEYFLDIAGATGANTPPTIVDIDPNDGELVGVFPDTITVDFSELVAFSSIDPANVLVGGVPVLDVTPIDGDTVQFTVDPAVFAGDGEYLITFAIGAVADLQGLGLATSFQSSFTVDTTGPVITSLAWNGGAFPADGNFNDGPLTVTALFTEPLFTLRSARTGLKSPGTEDVQLIDAVSGLIQVPDSVSFDPQSLAFTANFDFVAEGAYTLRFISGDGAFEDRVGNDLDGEPLGPSDDFAPTGDGVAGGDYLINITTDFDVKLADPFVRFPLLGSLIGVADNNSSYLGNGDTDGFRFYAHAGETISAIATPTTSTSAILTMELLGVAGPISGLVGGDSVVLPPVTIPADGFYTIEMSADVETAIDLDLVLNAIRETSVGDSDDGNELAIDSTAIPLGGGRFAVIGDATPVPGGVAFIPSNDPTKFVDISATGTALGLGDDGEANIVTSVGNDLIPAGTFTVGNNGVLAGGGGVNVDYVNDALPTADFDLALLPFWDDIDSDTGDVYWQELQIGGIDALVVQWHQRPHYSNTGAATFQVQIFDSGPVAARFVYPDVDFGNSLFNFGASATIGFQADSSTAYQYSFNSAVLANNDVLDLVEGSTASDLDEFEIDLTGRAGQPLDILLKGVDDDFSAESLQLIAPDGTTVLATGTANPLGQPATNFDLGILAFEVPSDGIYTLRVTSSIATGQYGLVVTDSLVYEGEENDSAATDALRSLDGVGIGIGHLTSGGGATVVHSTRSAFVAAAGALVTEDFEEATIPAGAGLEFCDSPLDSNSNDACFSPGDIQDGLVIQDDPTPGAGELVVLDDGFIGNISRVLGPTTFADNLQLFFPNNDVFSVGMDIWTNTSGPVDYEIIGTGGIIDAGTITVVAGSATFFGVTTGEVITQVNINSPNGELVDNVAFGGSIFDNDNWEVTLAAGQQISLAARQVFAGDDYSPVNDLDPELFVIHPDGSTIVASDQNSLDGRGALVTFTAPDAGVYTLNVRAEAGRGEYLLYEFENINQPPQDILISNNSVAENTSTAGGLTVGTLSAVDPNPGDTFTFQLVDGAGANDNDLFSIAADQLAVEDGVVLDFETREFYTVRVRVTDAQGATFDRDLTIDVTDRVEVAEVVIGDGTSQRSRVDQMTVVFDTEVTLDAGAIVVTKLGTGGGDVAVQTSTEVINGQTVATISFAGPLTQFGSLSDGNYTLRVVGSLVSGGGELLDGNQDGTPGGDFLIGDNAADEVFRLFGDTNGDRMVSNLEFQAFRAAFGKSLGSAAYDAVFDFELNGSIGVSDYAEFRRRLGQSLGF